ncbi:MAG: endonuclease/exonuclease/phosphatase family protein [Planctomycetes bacterium]|nr:endonuclease/exonuclease/phosphatase family protein [Planctomycetota bacterium]
MIRRISGEQSLSLVAASLAFCVCLSGCDPNLEKIADTIATPQQGSSQAPVPPPGQFISARPTAVRSRGLPARTGQTILVATFNIQAFGRSKMEKPGMPERLGEIIRQFDVVAIQEVRDKSQETIPSLMRYINSTGARYDYLISPPLGRTSSKEQYVYIFDTNTVVSSQQATYLVQDDRDLLHREPLVARFVTKVPPNVPRFSFTLVNIHTDPDEVSQELPVMDTVLKSVRYFEYKDAMEDDVLLLGDLNAEPRQFGPLGQLPGIMWVISQEPTNTRRTKIYDNIIFDRVLTNEFTGRAGVLDLGEMFGLRTEQVLEISDHLPVWAEFSIMEQASGATGAQFANSAGPAGYR